MKVIDPGLRSFVAFYGSHELDASLLLLPLVGFLSINDERIAGTIAAIERDLVSDGLVRRSRPHRADPEGAFLACTCWLADCQMMQGRHEAARKTFERLLAVRNDLGLLSEEYDVEAGRTLRQLSASAQPPCLGANRPCALRAGYDPWDFGLDHESGRIQG